MTIAEQVAKDAVGDGRKFNSPHGNRIDAICERLGGRYEQSQTRTDLERWIFADDSVITIAGGGWDLGYADCWCWHGAGHGEHCEIEIEREEFERAAGGRVAAVEYEQQALSCGDEFLPPCALEAKSAGRRTAEYWRWLCGQINEQMVTEALADADEAMRRG